MLFPARSRSRFYLRRLLSWLSSSSSSFRSCSTGRPFFLSFGASRYIPCCRPIRRPPLFGTSLLRRSPEQRQQLRPRPRQLLALSDVQGVIGALLVKSPRARCQHT